MIEKKEEIFKKIFTNNYQSSSQASSNIRVVLMHER